MTSDSSASRDAPGPASQPEHPGGQPCPDEANAPLGHGPPGEPETWLVTGGAGFIGCNFVRSSLADPGGIRIVNYDKLTYAGRLENLADLTGHPRHLLVHGDICDSKLVGRVLAEHQPDAIVHLAAESHVDRSIAGPAAFIQTNILGTFALLEQTRAYVDGLPDPRRARFRFLQVSTDEVYGSAGPGDLPFTENAPYAPSSPYAASKAAADHLVLAAHRTYGLPGLVVHPSNNFGPYQFPEKFLPVIILGALTGKAIPIYGDGLNVRDWLSVHDHCDGLRVLLRRGQPGQRYNITAGNPTTNLALAREVCSMVDELVPERAPAARWIRFVADRPGHDRRYAIDPGKLARELGWRPRTSFQAALRETVQWYIDQHARGSA